MTAHLTALLLSLACPAAAQVAVSTPAATVDQLYRPVNGRDPLLPATVFGDQKAPSAKQEQPAAAPAGQAKPEAAQPAVAKGSFTVYGLVLTGILEDAAGRQALLRDQSTGLLYTLKAGRLLDSKKKAVPGVSGVVKGKQVVFMTEDKKVHQVNLREKE